MTTIRTGTLLTRSDIRGLEHGVYELLTMETREKETGVGETFIWEREDDLGIAEYALPY